MSWRVYGQIKDIVIQLNGTDIEIVVLKPYGLGASWSNTFFNTYGATSGLVNASVSIRGESDPQYDTWAEYQAVLGLSPDSQCNDEYLFSKFTQVGDIISYTHKDINRDVCRLDVKWSRTLTESGYTHNDIQWRIVYNGNTDGWSGNIIAHGRDSQGKIRHFQWGVCLDLENAVAMIHYYWGAMNPNRYTDNRGSCTSYADSMSRNDFNARKYGLYTLFSGVYVPPEPTDDPYPSNNYDESIQGPGNFDDTSDTIDMPTTPALTVTSSRFVTIYTPSAQQIEDLAGRLIDPTVFQSLANAVEDMSSCVIGLHIVPIVVPYTVSDRQVCCNFMGISIGLGVYLNRATAQFLDVDCGSLGVEEYWGNCLDYAPYTQISLFLPFCGFYDLDVDEVMGKTIQVKYRVDIASGSCMASIIVNGSVMYQYSGNCSQQIPVSSVDFNSFLTNAFSVAVATATSGAAVAAAGSAVLGAGDSTSPQSSHQMDSAGVEKLAMTHYDTVKMRAEGRIAGAAVNAVMNSKPHYNHGGSLSGSTGFLGCKKPYLIIKRPNPMIPDMYGKFHGYPCNTTANLNDLVGYTEVADIRLNIPDATVDEIIECERLLKDGVVL